MQESGGVKLVEDAQDYLGPTSSRGRARPYPVGAVLKRYSVDAERQRRSHPRTIVKRRLDADELAPQSRPASLCPPRCLARTCMLRPLGSLVAVTHGGEVTVAVADEA